MTDSCSLTPPTSPRYNDEKCMFQPQELQNLAKIPCFSCKNSIFCSFSNAHGDYLKDDYLHKIIKKEEFFSNLPKTILLFNKSYATEIALWTDGQKLFSFAKKYFGILKSSIHPDLQIQINDEELFQIRMQLCSFLTFIKDSVLKLNSKIVKKQERCSFSTPVIQIKKLLSNVFIEVKGLLLFAGRLCHIPDIITNNVLSDNGRNSFHCYHYFHICLDLWWSMLEILHIACNLPNITSLHGDPNGDTFHILINDFKAFFSQTVNELIFDLCLLASKNFKISNDAATPFLCPCVKQFWIQLILLLEKIFETQNEKSFWSQLNETYQYVLQNNTIANGNLNNLKGMFKFGISELSNNASFCEFFLWLTCYIAPLTTYDIKGNHISLQKSTSCYSIPKYLIEYALNDESMLKSEIHLRKMLTYLFLLIKQWEPKGDVLLLLTDFYVKKINDIFCKSKLEIGDMSYIFKTSNCWLNIIRSIVSEDHQLDSTENSFHLYLRILSTQLSQSSLTSSLWRQIKGRIYSKFTPKRLKELSEAGLQNCFSIFLTVAFSINLEEMSSKICEFADIIQNNPSNTKKQMVAWKALFVLLFMHQEQHKNLDKIGSKVVHLFNDSCSKYVSSIKEPCTQNSLMNLISLYVENMGDIFEKSDHLTSSEYILIGSGFCHLLPACTNELNYLLNIFLNILLKFCNLIKSNTNELHETHYLMLLQSLFEYVFPFVKNHVSTNTPPYQLADLAVAFTYLSIKLALPLIKVTSSSTESLFKYFSNSLDVNPAISARYLNFMLNDSYAMENLKSTIDDFSTILVQSWLKCSVLLIPPCDQMQELTKQVLQLCEVKTMFPDVEKIAFSGSLHDFLSIRFFKIMSQTYQNCSSLQEKNSIKEKIQLYFLNISLIISSKMKHNIPIAFFMHLYKLMGHLVEYCAPLLYFKNSRNNIFPKLIDVLLFPHIMFPKDKFLLATLSRPIKENLILFLTGMLKLDYKHEPYVKRILKSLVIHYVDNFTIKNNPILCICITAATEKTFPLDCNAFNFIINVLKDHILVNFNGNSTSGFRFLCEVVKKIPSASKKELCELLINDLITLFLRFDGTLLSPVKELLSMLFSFMKCEMHVLYQKQLLLPLCENLITEKLAWAQHKVFRILEYLSHYFVNVIAELIPFIIKHIEYVESQRGSGIDIMLRKELKTLTDNLHVTQSTSTL